MPPSRITRSRALAAAFVAVAAAASGCGEIHFVTSPYTVRSLAITYSVQEDVTLFAWRLGDVDTEEVRFELLAGGHWVPVEFERAPFPSGPERCGAETCYLLTRPGRYAAPPDRRALRSLHDLHGVMLGGVGDVRDVATTLSFTPHFLPRNAQVDLGVTDGLSAPKSALRRRFRYDFEATASECEAVQSLSDGTTAGAEIVRAPGVLSSEGRYCVTLNPVRNGGAPVTVAAEAFAHPDLKSRAFDWKPAVELAPIVYQIIFDLEIPNPERCESTMTQLQLVLRELEARGPSHQLPPLYLASDGTTRCRQQAERHLPLATMVENVREYVNTEILEPAGTRVLFIYANNLAFPLSEDFEAELRALPILVAENPRSDAVVIAIASEPVISSGIFAESLGWIHPWDKGLKETVKELALRALPFKTMVHDNDGPIAFVDADLASIAGLEVKLCGATPSIRLKQGGVRLPNEQLVVTNDPARPFQFSVVFGEQRLVPNRDYSENPVDLRYEACSRYCRHPFQTTTGEWVANWHSETRCREAFEAPQ